MLDNIKVEDIFFLDIETVPGISSYELLDPVNAGSVGKEIKTFQIC